VRDAVDAHGEVRVVDLRDDVGARQVQQVGVALDVGQHLASVPPGQVEVQEDEIGAIRPGVIALPPEIGDHRRAVAEDLDPGRGSRRHLDHHERLPGAQNYRIRVAERDGEVIFLYKIERGRASKSYGIEVARLAGLPPGVLSRAREVLGRLERYELDVFAEEGGGASGVNAPSDESVAVENGAGVVNANGSGVKPHAAQAGAAQTDVQVSDEDTALGRAASRAGRRSLAAQFTLFDTVNRGLLDELRGVDVETLSAEDARQILLGLKNRIV
jgi:hypothetical protein